MSIDFDLLYEKLSKAPDERPWKTAKSLAKSLAFDVSEDKVNAIETCLHRHWLENHHDPDKLKVRYSALPSKKTLALLWGATEKVGHRNLRNITKDDIVDEIKGIDQLSGDTPSVFISHSHQDFLAVKHLAIDLATDEGGPSLAPWLAETHIEEGGLINQSIMDSLQNCDAVLLYLSSNVFNSKWTAKECHLALGNGKPLFVAIDLQAPEMAEALSDMLRAAQPLRYGRYTEQFAELLEILQQQPGPRLFSRQADTLHHPNLSDVKDLPEAIRQAVKKMP